MSKTDTKAIVLTRLTLTFQIGERAEFLNKSTQKRYNSFLFGFKNKACLNHGILLFKNDVL